MSTTYNSESNGKTQDHFAETQDWKQNSTKLLDFFDRLVVRHDTFGGYKPDGKPYTAHSQLTTPKLLNHFSGISTIGIHAVKPEDNTARFVTHDIDLHDEMKPHKGEDQAPPADPIKNLKYALHIHNKYKALGIDCLLFDSNGRGGYHCWVAFDTFISAGRMRTFGQWVASDHKEFDVCMPEVFPKQADIKGKFGNWVRLPGKHHKRPHWTKVWNGTQWLKGAECIEFIADYQAQSISLIPAEADTYKPPVKEKKPKPAQWDGAYNDDQWWLNYTGDLTTLDIVGLLTDEGLYIGEETDEKHIVRCPWEHEHTTDTGGTCIWDVLGKFPSFNCLHAHCAGRTIEDVLAFFGKGRVNEYCVRQIKVDSLPDEGEQAEQVVGHYEQMKTDSTSDFIQYVVKQAADATEKKIKNDHEQAVKQLEGWNELKRKAKEKPPMPLIEDLILFGDTHFITALPWGGKSTILGEAIAAVCQGTEFFGFKTKQGKVLYINSDQTPYDLVYDRINQGVHNDAAMGQNYFQHCFDTLPCPMDTEYLLSFITEQTVQFDWVIIDTLRTALLTECEKGTENDAGIAKYVQPFRTLAKKKNMVITFVHHNNKTHDKMAGSAVLQGLADSIWTCFREEKATTVDVKAQHRRGWYKEFSVMRDENGRLDKVGVAGSSKLNYFIDFFGSFPGKTLPDVYEAQKVWFGAMGISDEHAKNWLTDAQKAGLQRHPQDTARNKAARYFKAES